MSSSCSQFDVHLECRKCNRRGEAKAHRYGGWSNSDRDARVHYHEVSKGFVALSAQNGHEGYDVACGDCGLDVQIRRPQGVDLIVDPAPRFVPRSFWEVATSGFRQRTAADSDGY